MEAYLQERIPQAKNYPRDQGEWIFKDLSKGHLAKKKFLNQNFQNFYNIRVERERGPKEVPNFLF